MNPFEYNSIHLNEAGYRFGIAKLKGKTSKALTKTKEEGVLVVPLWVNPDKTSKDKLYAILGSEPKIGEHPEVEIPQEEVKNLIYSEPVRFN